MNRARLEGKEAAAEQRFLDGELRKLALFEAVRHNTPGGPAEVVHAAEKYLAFLKGKPTKRGK